MPPESKPPASLVVRGTELSTEDPRERYREKIARITLDSMFQFVGLLDAKGTVLEINKVALDAVGITLADVEGKPFWETFWWQVSEEVNATLRALIVRASQGEFVRWDTPIFGRAGGKEAIIIDSSLMPVKDDRGEVVFIAAEGRDITEKKAYEREIARQREELAQLDKLKTQLSEEVLPGARILVADDNSDMREYIQRLLAGYDVVAVADGAAALRLARARRPDLVLTDVMMPGVDGLDLMRAFRADPALSYVPVIFLSARAGEESRIEGLEAGADEYLVKPFSARELLACVRAQLRLAESRRLSREALRASEQRYRALVTASSDVVFQMTGDWSVMSPLDGRDLVASNSTQILGWMEKNLPEFEHARVQAAIDDAIGSKQMFDGSAARPSGPAHRRPARRVPHQPQQAGAAARAGHAGRRGGTRGRGGAAGDRRRRARAVRHPAHAARALRCGSHPAGPGALQPARQLGEVHRAWRHHLAVRRTERRRRRGHGHRPRHRHPGRIAADDLRHVLPGRPQHRAGGRRTGNRSGAGERAHRDARRHRGGQERRRRTGQHVRRHVAGQSGRGARGRPRRAALAAGAAGPPGAGRGRQPGRRGEPRYDARTRRATRWRWPSTGSRRSSGRNSSARKSS